MNEPLDTTVHGQYVPDSPPLEQASNARGGLADWIAAHPKAAVALIIVMSVPFWLTCVGMTLLFVVQTASGGCGG